MPWPRGTQSLRKPSARPVPTRTLPHSASGLGSCRPASWCRATSQLGGSPTPAQHSGCLHPALQVIQCPKKRHSTAQQLIAALLRAPHLQIALSQGSDTTLCPPSNSGAILALCDQNCLGVSFYSPALLLYLHLALSPSAHWTWGDGLLFPLSSSRILRPPALTQPRAPLWVSLCLCWLTLVFFQDHH